MHTLLKQTAASLQTTATLDQAGSHDQAPKTDRTKFDLRLSNPMGRPVTSTANAHPEIEAESPTEDQLQSILDYAGEENAGTIVEGATSKKDALYKFKTQHGANLIKPLVVDWNKGRVGKNWNQYVELLIFLTRHSVRR